jgi:hypothetical protein
MSYLIQELLAIRETMILTERVDTMLDSLRTHFSNKSNPDPVKIFSKEDLVQTSYQLAGLNYILNQQDLSKKLPELDDHRTLITFFNELDEPQERKLFNDRSQTADEYLALIGKKYDSSTSKKLLKQFEELKAMKNITMNSESVARFVASLENKLKEFLKTVK